MTQEHPGRWTPSGCSRPDLRELVEEARAGDVAAWQDLYLALYPRLLAYARRQVGPHDAPDLVSEAVVRALSGLARFEWTGAGFDAWIFRILRHVIIDHHRRDGRRSRLPLSDARDLQEDEAADWLLADEESREMRAALARLGPEDQELLHLRVVAGLTSEEVAQVLGKRPGAVRMAQARSLQRLRALMSEMEIGDDRAV